MGSYSYRERLFAYPNTELCSVPPGPIGCIFQSGGTLQFWLKSAAERGMGFSYAVSSGNEADLDLADFLDFLVDDPHTKQIVLFIEGIRRPQAFMRAAARALEAGKPILAIKTGATQKSRSAAQSHTGAIGGDYAAYLAMCERYGIVNCRSLDDLLETALAFQCGRLPKGPRIGFVTTSGGTVDLLYDYAETEGAVIPEFSAATNAALMPHMQEGILPKNPLDTGIPTTLKVAADQCEIVARDPNVDIVAWASPLPGKGGSWDDVHELRRLLAATDKPIIAFGRMIHQMTAEGLGRAGEGRISIPAGPATDAARDQCAVVPCAAGGPLTAASAACAGKRSDARQFGCHARALRHHAASKPAHRERARGG